MIILSHIFNKIIYLYMYAYLISGAQNCIYNFLVTLLGTSLLLISYLQERIFNNFSMETRKNVITIVPSIIELYSQTKRFRASVSIKCKRGMEALSKFEAISNSIIKNQVGCIDFCSALKVTTSTIHP
jgi:hypothetical protein